MMNYFSRKVDQRKVISLISSRDLTAQKVSKYAAYSDPNFLAYGLNTEI